MPPRKKPLPRKPKPKAKTRRSSDVVDDARAALLKGWPRTDANTEAALVLFALARTLRRHGMDERAAAALGDLAAAARRALDRMGHAAPATSDASGPEHAGVGVDELAHERFAVQSMSEMLAHQRDALSAQRGPPPLPALHMAQALSRVLGSGPLLRRYEGALTAVQDGGASRIVEAWSRHVAVDGCIHVKEEPITLARKLVADALFGLAGR